MAERANEINLVRLASETFRNANVTFEWTPPRLKEQFFDCDGRVNLSPS